MEIVNVKGLEKAVVGVVEDGAVAGLAVLRGPAFPGTSKKQTFYHAKLALSEQECYQFQARLRDPLAEPMLVSVQKRQYVPVTIGRQTVYARAAGGGGQGVVLMSTRTRRYILVVTHNATTSSGHIVGLVARAAMKL